MKTNQTMILQFSDKTLAVEHKTKMGSLTELWAIGNSIRESKGLTQLDMAHYLRSPETLELVQAIERKYGIKCSDPAEVKNGRTPTITSDLIVTKRGRYTGGTFAHKYILLHAASRFGADFQIMIYEKIADLESVLSALSSFEVDEEILESSTRKLFVYAIREVESRNIKIGISYDPEARLRQLQTGNSSRLELVAFIEAAEGFKSEKDAHRLNKGIHIRGEWFGSGATLGGRHA